MKVVFAAVTKNFGSTKVLDELSFTVKKGSFTFIIGPSGVGKTTIIRLILSQSKVTSGQIMLGKLDLTHAKKRQLENYRKRIGVIYQDFQLIPDKTIRENIQLALDIIKAPKAELQDRVREAAEKTELVDRLDFFPSQLSGGELQRASLARALAVRPKLILADEPTGNLDPKSAWKLMSLLKRINETEKTTIIMTTHNSEIVNKMRLRVLRLSGGKISSDKKRGEYTLE